MSGEYVPSDIPPKEAVRRLARILYESLQSTRNWSVSWDELPARAKIDFYDAILLLSDSDGYWRIVFDDPDDDCVSGSVIDGE
jgi:hypothetical protein